MQIISCVELRINCHLNIFSFGRGVTDQKIRHLSGEFRRSFGPWGAGNLNEPIFKSSKDGGGGGVGGWVLPRGWDFEALK